MLIAAVASLADAAPVIWTGPTIDFVKAPHVGVALPEDRDVVTPGVILTRDETQGFYNAASELSYQSTSPAGTLWALGTTSQDIATLSFGTFTSLINPGGPISGIGSFDFSTGSLDFVVHLTNEDVYLDLRLTGWGQGRDAGGGFAYTRSTAAVPEPSTLAMLVGAMGVCVSARRIGTRPATDKVT
ncbi:PEP-CTERM sorting domain-containing protein [Pirellulimonas nuda]|uniref:PEP-CTERM sorting domain-containing protein n=1 Tax=Pirellulimonas nuda TaxID=2528009 RepID=UPI0018D432AD|nr:PEP-CTERM sorting domain-containing protein [Pirellulimonas nuda]